MRYAFLPLPNQNMAMNRPSIVRILTSLVSLESCESQRFNGANFIKIRPILGRFMAIFEILEHFRTILLNFRYQFWTFFDDFCKNAKKSDQNMATNRPYIARILTRMASIKR